MSSNSSRSRSSDEDTSDEEPQDLMKEQHQNESVASPGSFYQGSSQASSSESDASEEGTATAPKTVQKRKRDPSPISVRLSKRRRGEFYPDYLAILNANIQDVALGFIAADFPREQDVPFRKGHNMRILPASQLGASFWTSDEKIRCMAAISRLGRDDLPGIAARVPTKSQPEISQYLRFLEQADPDRRARDRGTAGSFHALDMPAAVELSEGCCRALEAAADAVSVRQEADEDEVEEARWGHIWNVTAAIAEELEALQVEEDGPDPNTSLGPGFARPKRASLPDFAVFFHLPIWIELSCRIFMNSSSPDLNWQLAGNHLPLVTDALRRSRGKILEKPYHAMGEQPPSIRATALQDFHSLVANITRRLVMATLYMAESRIRSVTKPVSEDGRDGGNDEDDESSNEEQVGDEQRPHRQSEQRRPKGSVRRADVFAAAASLGLKADSRDFWRGCARRLNLDVYRQEKYVPTINAVPQRANKLAKSPWRQPMPFDDVEKELRRPANVRRSALDPKVIHEGGYLSAEFVEDSSGSEVASSDDAESTARDLDEEALDETLPGNENKSGGNTQGDRGDQPSDDVDEFDRDEDGDEEEDDDGYDDDEELAVAQEVDEVTRCRPLDGPHLAASLAEVRFRVRWERQCEARAEEQDMSNSREAEAQLWAALGLSASLPGGGAADSSTPRRRRSTASASASAPASFAALRSPDPDVKGSDREDGSDNNADDRSDEQADEDEDGIEDEDDAAREARSRDEGKKRRHMTAYRPLDDLYPTGTDWRRHTGYYADWETVGGRAGTSQPFRPGRYRRSVGTRGFQPQE